MKKMILKIALATLVIGSVPMHAGLGQLVQNGARTVLQGAGNNAGRVAVAMGVLGAIAGLIEIHKSYKKFVKITNEASLLIPKDKKEELEAANQQRYWMYSLVAASSASISAGFYYVLAKACGWVGSKI